MLEQPKYKIKKVEKWILYETATDREVAVYDDEGEALYDFQNINNIILD